MCLDGPHGQTHNKHMAHFYKRGKTWWVQFSGPDGGVVRKSTKASRKKEAQKIGEDLAAGMRREASKPNALAKVYQDLLLRAANDASEGKLTIKRTKDLIEQLHQISHPDYVRISLNDHLDEWIKTEAAYVAPKTVEIYGNVRSLMVSALGKKAADGPIDEISTPMVKRALNQIRKKHAASTTNLALRTFRRAMEAAVASGLCASNAAGAHVIRPYPETDSKIVTPFTREEFATLLSFTRDAYNHDEWCGAILIGGHTGLRMGDILSLTTKNIHDGRFVVKQKKTSDVITVPLTPPVFSWVADKKGPLFPILSAKGKGSLSTTFTRIMERAGVPRDVDVPGQERMGRRSFHSLRHSFASWLADADVHSDVRKKLTGHKSDGIHAEYSHHDEALERAVESLPGA